MNWLAKVGGPTGSQPPDFGPGQTASGPVLRAVVAADEAALGRFFARLSLQSRYERFFSGIITVPDETLRAFARADQVDHVALVALEGGQIVADGRLVHDGTGEAEIAVVVSDAFQGRGIGRRMVGALIEQARARGWTHIRADFLSENRRMIGLLRDAGFAISRDAHSAVFGHGALSLAGAGEPTVPPPARNPVTMEFAQAPSALTKEESA